MSATTHEAKVRALAAQVLECARLGQTVRPVKKGVSHVVPIPDDPKSRIQPIDISALDQILSIDAKAGLCVAEPGVSFSRIVDATLPLGLVPTVVPELEGITVGGAVAGCSVESMSYKYGGFHDSCVEYEIVTGDGEILTCSRDVEPDVFEMIHGSYGTLALLTKLTFRLVPATPYVRMEYRTYTTLEAFHADLLQRCRDDDYDLVDGIIHGPDQFVLCLGTFVDDPPYVSDYRWLNIYYKSTAARTEDYMATKHYFFRYDAECHWMTKTVPPMEWKPVRFLIGKWLLGSTNMIRTSRRLESVYRMKRRPDVVVDVFIPNRNFPKFFHWYEKEFAFWPLWIVPYKARAYPWLDDAHVERMSDEFMIDCAVYGKPNSAPDVDLSKVLEDKTYELNGFKTLISRNHHAEDRFWSVYSKPRYTAAKARLDPRGTLPHLFTLLGRVE